jgi:hypothetical protein
MILIWYDIKKNLILVTSAIKAFSNKMTPNHRFFESTADVWKVQLRKVPTEYFKYYNATLYFVNQSIQNFIFRSYFETRPGQAMALFIFKRAWSANSKMVLMRPLRTELLKNYYLKTPLQIKLPDLFLLKNLLFQAKKIIHWTKISCNGVNHPATNRVLAWTTTCL